MGNIDDMENDKVNGTVNGKVNGMVNGKVNGTVNGILMENELLWDIYMESNDI